MHHGLRIQITFEISREKTCSRAYGKTAANSTGNVMKVESAISNDRRHTVRDLAKISG